MKQAMKTYAEKLMMKTHAAVKKYQLAQEMHKEEPLVQQNIFDLFYIKCEFFLQEERIMQW